jgi:putative tricarboxylic transport membrane protein
MNKWDRVTGYVFLVLGVATAISSEFQLKMGTARHPGPGFFPMLLSLALIALSLALIFQHWRKDDKPAPFWPERTWVRPTLGVALLVAYSFIVGFIGFFITTFLFILLWMWIIERLKWKVMLSISAGTTAVLWLIFVYFLDVPMPTGFLTF